jgi:hypothetical protein
LLDFAFDTEDRGNIKSRVFWDITPRNPLKVNQRFGGRDRSVLLATFSMLVSSLACSSTLKM